MKLISILSELCPQLIANKSSTSSLVTIVVTTLLLNSHWLEVSLYVAKLKLLPKDKIKENIGRSPDYLDNFIMRMSFEVKTNRVNTSATF